MTEMPRHEDLRSEVRGTQHALVALLQERLETETPLKAARAELEQVTRGIEQARSEHTRQVAEFDGLVRGAIAEGKTVAAEIEELVRRRDVELEHQATAAPHTTPPLASILASRQQSPAPSERQADVARSTIALAPVTRPAPDGLPAALPERVPQLVRSAASSVRQRTPQLVVPAGPNAPQHAPRLSGPAISALEPARLSAMRRSMRARLTALHEQLTAQRSVAVFARMRSHRPGLRQVASLCIGCMLVFLAVLLTPVSQVAGGLQLLAVMSGSMEPTIRVGGIVGVRPVAVTDLQVGNVITFATQANPDVLVTHRIVSLETRDGQTMVTTKGDANDSVDAMAAPADHAVGRVDFSLPWLGFLMVWLASPVAKILILVFTVISFALPSVKRPAEHVRPHGAAGQPPATSYTALEDEIQAHLTTPTLAP
jgi:signal peptidase